jgi:CRP-like cAMP-binding protein
MTSLSSSSSQDEETNLLGWETFFNELGSFSDTSGRTFQSANEAYSSYAIERLETCIITLALVTEILEEAVSGGNGSLGAYVEMIRELSEICRTMSVKYEQKLEQIEARSAGTGVAYQPQLEVRAGRGRPCFDISREQLLYLSSLSFTWTDISHMLGVSRMTIYRRRVMYDLVREPGIIPTDAQLCILLREMKMGHPELGEVLVMGRLRGMGYKVTRERLRQATRRIDPLCTALRWKGGITSRRPYSVPGPNSLWHIGECSQILENISIATSNGSSNSV